MMMNTADERLKKEDTRFFQRGEILNDVQNYIRGYPRRKRTYEMRVLTRHEKYEDRFHYVG